MNNITIPGTEIVIEIAPYDQLGYELHTLSLFEEIGGKLASGRLTLSLAANIEHGNPDEVIKWNDLYILIKDYSNSVTYRIYGWITRKETLEKMMCLDFLVFPYFEGGMDNYCRQFLTLTRNIAHPIQKESGEGLKQLVCSLWKGSWQREPWPDIRCSAISNNNLPDYIWQRDESDYAFLNKILYSYNSNIVFGYGIGGLFIKDIKDVNKNLSIDTLQTVQTTGLSRNFEYRLHQDLQDPWENDDSSGIISVRTFDNKYFISSKEYSSLLEAYQRNKILMSTRFFSSFEVYTTIQLPEPSLGDCIIREYSNGQTKNEGKGLFINTSNQYFFAKATSGDRDANGNIFSVTSIYRGIEDNQQELFKDTKEVTDIFKLNKLV